MSISPTPGTVLDGKFRLDRLLGEGGMGSVWAATNLSTRKAVALKLLKGNASPSALRRFVREARLASAVQHPNLVAVHDVSLMSDGVPALVMDLLDGETLRVRLLREGRVPLAELTRLILPVFDALQAAHGCGIVHRDLKPENLFLHRDRSGGVRVIVLDFGIAKRVASEREHESSAVLTGTGDILGTFEYMAPEQFFGGKITPASDIWALGVILHECLCGERPFSGSNFGQFMREAILAGVRPLLEQTLGAQPADVRELISSALVENPSERPGLERFGSVLGRYASAASEHAPPPKPTSTSSFALASTVLAPSKSSRRRALGIGALLLVSSVGVYSALRGVAPRRLVPGSVDAARQTSFAAAPHSSAPPASANQAEPAAANQPVPAPAFATTSNLTESAGREPAASAAVSPSQSGAARSVKRPSAQREAASAPKPGAVTRPTKAEFKPVTTVPF